MLYDFFEHKNLNFITVFQIKIIARYFCALERTEVSFLMSLELFS